MNKVKITCYGQTKEWTKENALKFFTEAMFSCGGSEQERYIYIVEQLKENQAIIDDRNRFLVF